MRNPIRGLSEFNTASEFLFAADQLIHHVYSVVPETAKAPRSLVNLTFLSLEVSLKCHLARLNGTYPKTHDLPKLLAALDAQADGRQLVGMVAAGYGELMAAGRGSFPEYNRTFATLDELLAVLTKDAFIEWRYIFESLEQKVLSQQVEFVMFPFVNLYLVALIFLRLAGEAVEGTAIPPVLEYKKMPFWFRIRLQESGRAALVWDTCTKPLLLAQANRGEPKHG